MRIILYTGKGGVGKTSAAAATAAAAASAGKRTIVVSTDAAHSLGDSFNLELGQEPLKIKENLWAQEVSVVESADKYWGKVQKYLSTLLLSQNVKDITAEEFIVFPGLEELFSMFEILRHYEEEKYDVIVVDCAPTGETLRLLSFPEVLKWWLEKIFPLEKRLIKYVRPVAKPLLGLPLPEDDMLDSVAALVQQLESMHELLTDHEVTSVRIVVNPEKMVIKEAERSFMYLSLYGFNTDAVIVNRMLPADDLGGYFNQWGALQQKHYQYIVKQFNPIPIFPVRLFKEEVVGIEALDEMAKECFKMAAPDKIFYAGQPVKLMSLDGCYVLELKLNFAAKDMIDLSQKGNELSLQVGSYKRNIMLPRKLYGCEAKGAKLTDGVLKITFGDAGNE
ncbi:MAG: TRC40/GET3/ArsA family transport-energizing ATPase [Pelosinus sp.]|nr:TRC40/GET3/ArsA family transport-energizing ATPase [Pelosinus sp.]